METNQFDQLMTSVLEGRSYDALSESIGMPTVLLLITLLVIGVALAVWWSDASENDIPTLCKFIKAYVAAFAVFILLGSAHLYTRYKAAGCPTMDDAKLIVTYKVGEQVVNSPKFQELVDRTVEAIPANMAEKH